MKEHKVVHFHLFRPDKSLFKQKANTPSEIQTIICTNPDNCRLLSRKECACRHGLFGHCPYGKQHIKTGFTKRARKYYSWNAEQKKKYEGVPFLRDPERLDIVGDYVFLPYSHINLIKNFPVESRHFIKREDFTVDNIIRLVKATPRALLYNKEITSYQEDMPLLLKHLSEQMPELFKEVIEKDAVCADRYAEFSNIGRKAILQTLTQGIGKFKDIHSGLWNWDGVELHSENSKMSFGLCQFSKVSITPIEKQEVKVTDENQVNKNTVFID